MMPTLPEIVDYARGAGAILRGGYGKQHSVNHKGRIDLVTEMDHRSETYLLERIRAAYPDHMILSEESGQILGNEKYRWYLDPLDGTTNYAHHLPIFAVSIGFWAEGQMQMGVVYDPMRDECFSGERGKGAWLNGQPIRVSETKELLHSLVVTGFPYDSLPSGKSNLENFAHFTRLTRGVRRLGSAALDMCYVAAGRFDAYWEQTLQAHDLAAGALIVEEAGGRVTTLAGEADYLKPPYAVLAGTPAVHALMLEEFLHRL